MVMKNNGYQYNPKNDIFNCERNDAHFAAFHSHIPKRLSEKWELEFVSCSWNACLKRLKSGELDIMLDIAYSEKRAKKFNFSQENVFLNWATIYTRKDFVTTAFLDLNERTIATVKEDIHTVGEDGIEHLISKFELDKEIHWYCQDD